MQCTACVRISTDHCPITQNATPRITEVSHAQAFAELLTPRTKIVALVHVSNMLGSILDTDYVVEQAHKVDFCSLTLQPLASCGSETCPKVPITGLAS